MPIFDTLRKLAGCAVPGREEREEEPAMAPASQFIPLPVQQEPAAPEAPGRPYADFVEDEARKYWQDMVRVGGALKKPQRQELRAAARPVLMKALRRRQGKTPDPALARYRAHQGVIALQNHAIERGWLTPPFAHLPECPGYAEALVKLAQDPGWLYPKVRLPAHPDPQHPPIYYSIDPGTGNPVPREDSLLRGEYLRYGPGYRLIPDESIPPWRNPGSWPKKKDLKKLGRTACYSLEINRGKIDLYIHFLQGDQSGVCSCNVDSFRYSELYFSPCPPAS